MFNAKQYRDKASEYAERGKNADGPKEAREFASLEKSFTTLADNEQWLSDNHQRTVRSPASDADIAPSLAQQDPSLAQQDPSLAQQEEHLLRCLGAAIIMQWDGLPSNVRRLLFDCATTMGHPLEVASLRERIARFLHKYQDAIEPTALTASKPPDSP